MSDFQKLEERVRHLEGELRGLQNGIRNHPNLLRLIDTLVEGSLDVSGAITQNGVPVTAPTAAVLLALLKTVDGAGSGLDADLLDGVSSAAFAPAVHNQAWSTITGTPATYPPAAHNQAWSTITGVPGYTFVPLLSPIGNTVTGWKDDVGKSTTPPASINVCTTFGVPTSAKAIAVRIAVRDTGALNSGSYHFSMGPDTTDYTALTVYCHGGGLYFCSSAIVPMNGQTCGWRVVASGAGTLFVTLSIWGYFV